MWNPVNHSYFFGDNVIYGYPNRSYFTYYSEFGRNAGWPVPLEVSLLVLILVLSVAANLCLAAVVILYQQLRTVTNYLILNLAVADVLFTASIPGVIAVRISETWILGDAICTLLMYFQFVCGAVLLWTLTLISVERYRCIVLPRTRFRLQLRHALGLNIGVWAVFLVFFIPVALTFNVLRFHNEKTHQTIKVCTLVFPPISEQFKLSYLFVILTITMTMVVPILWLIYNYHAIFRKLVDNERKWADPAVVQRRFSANISQEDLPRYSKHYRTVKILILDVCFTVAMWMPIGIMMGLIHWDSSKEDGYVIHSHYFIAAVLVALANTCVNPLLYGFLNTHFRMCLLDMWKSCPMSKHWRISRSMSSPTTNSMELDVIANISGTKAVQDLTKDKPVAQNSNTHKSNDSLTVTPQTEKGKRSKHQRLTEIKLTITNHANRIQKLFGQIPSLPNQQTETTVNK